MPDLPSPPFPMVVCCKAVLAALFAWCQVKDAAMVLRRAADSSRRWVCVGIEREKAMPDLPSPPFPTVVCCKAMLAALFAVKRRYPVV
jgi:hypothetical protein